MLKLPEIRPASRVAESRNYLAQTQKNFDTKMLRLNLKKLQVDMHKSDKESCKSSAKSSVRSGKKGMQSQKSSTKGESTAAHSNVSSDQFDEGFPEAAYCYLKTKSNKFKKFHIAIQDGQINFYKIVLPTDDDWEIEADKPRASHRLDNVHVMYGPIERHPETKELLYPVKLSFSDSYCRRQLYFDSQTYQQEWINNLLASQGFNDQVQQYEFEEKELRSSPVCAVKVATHKVSGTKAAMKVINKRNLKESKQSQYYHEASVMSLCKHPNVVKFMESFETKDEVYIATELQEGGDLINHVNKHYDGQHLPEENVRSLLYEIAKGLQYLHNHKIIHRDIKPENIVLTEDHIKNTVP